MGTHAKALTRTEREPVLTRAGIVTLIAVLAALLVHFGAPSAGHWLAGHSNAIAGALLTAAPVVSAALARLHVTPLGSPKDVAGNELVPAGSAAAVIDAAAVLAETELIHASDPVPTA